MMVKFVGYIASLLVFATFYVKTMITLRLIAIASNVGFIAFGYLEGLPSVLILHTCLLPLNLVRLRQFNRLMEKARSSVQGEVSLDALLPFMTPQWVKAGDVVFRKGDRSREMYYISEGQIRLVELDKTIGARGHTRRGWPFCTQQRANGDRGMRNGRRAFADAGGKVSPALQPEPRFGFQISRIITSRLIENYDKLLLASRAVGASKGSGTTRDHMAQKSRTSTSSGKTRSQNHATNG